MKLNRIVMLCAGSMILLATACGNGGNETATEAESGEMIFEITNEQFAAEKMAIGQMDTIVFEDVIRTQGTMMAPIQAKAEVNAKLPGMIRTIAFPAGSFVQKGQLLYTIESKEVINIQKEYYRLSREMEGLEKDFQRVSALAKENISSEKERVSMESQYKSNQALLSGLRAELALLNLEPDEAAKPVIQPYFSIYAPISGYITSQNGVIGQYVNPENRLLEIVDVSKLQIQFKLYEKDISRAKVGQKARLHMAGPDHTGSEARVMQVGKTVNPADKTVNCVASWIKVPENGLIDGMYVEMELIVGENKSMALSEEAVIKSGNQSFVYVLNKKSNDKYTFTRKEVKTGKSSRGFTEILGNEEIKDILVKGAFSMGGE